ncbi:MAG TPA: DegV family protein [Candidatus Gallacutalibacter stercoravium]|nr:DegV family protein [Candidatus Gallacutalibacter stercoravium]
MRKVKIITDSCADLSSAQLEKYDIDYVKMSTIKDGKESPALLTWSSAEAHDLYETIRGGKRITTAQVSVEEFNRVFGQYLEEGSDIVYIACSSKQSGSINTGHITAQKLLAHYPGAQISCIDSLNATIGEGMLAIEAAKMAASGNTVDEITSHIMAIRKNVQEFATVHTLEHLKKAGRVSASSAFFGNLMGVKPILVADANGAQAAYKKVKGRQASLQEIVALLKANIVDADKQTIYIAHADCSQEEVAYLAGLVKSEIPCKDISIGYIGPIVGASVGPDTIGVWAFGNPVTFAAGEKG